MANFTTQEMQFIRSCLNSKLDNEIAYILERPEHEVRQYIDEITEGDGEQREIRIKDGRTTKAAALSRTIQRKKQTKDSVVVQEDKARRQRIVKKAQDNLRKNRNIEEANRVNRDRQLQQKSFNTKQIDWEKMHRVQVDKGTWVIVPKSVSQKDAIKQYKVNTSTNIMRNKIKDHNF